MDLLRVFIEKEAYWSLAVLVVVSFFFYLNLGAFTGKVASSIRCVVTALYLNNWVGVGFGCFRFLISNLVLTLYILSFLYILLIYSDVFFGFAFEFDMLFVGVIFLIVVVIEIIFMRYFYG